MISVIFPVFNCEELLNDSINSILNQTLKEFELICIDNYSTDSSLSILKQFEKQDSRIKVFSCDSNHSLSYFINYCIERSKNRYIYFFEPHFVLKKDSFDHFLSQSDANEIDYLIFNYTNINQDNTSNLRFDLGKDFKIYENFELNSDFLFKIPISAGNVFFLKSFILDNNFYFDENLYENFYKLRFSSQKGIVLNESFANVEKNMQAYMNSIYEESNALFSIFQWLFKCREIYEYYKNDFLKFILNSFKELYSNLMDYNYSLDQVTIYHHEKYNIVNNLISIFDKFYFDYGIYDDVKLVDDSLFDFFNKFLINKGKYRLSIVIPVFNCEFYIHDALNSIINQTLNFDTIEVIFVDDCSDDKSPLIIKEFSQKYDNVKSFFLEKNSKYAGKPRNIALNNVTSNYVCFLDSDDYYYSNACEKLYYNMLCGHADLVAGNFSMDNVDGSKKKMIDGGISYFKNLNEFDVLKFDSVKDNPHILSSANIWNKMFKMDIIKENDISFLEGVPAQDSGFLFHYLLNTDNLIFIDDIVVHYHNLRNTEGNKSVTHLRNNLNIMGRIEVYHWMYGISLEYDVEELFVRNILRVKLPYWFNQLIATDLSDDDLKGIFSKYQVLFEKCVAYNVVLPKRLISIFGLIAASNFEETVKEFKKLK